MTITETTPGWLQRVDLSHGKVYLSLLEAIEGGIQAGELQPGDQLPTQRQVAALLGVDVNTVIRGYAIARDRGLVDATVGRGTFVSRGLIDEDYSRIILGLNPPPPPQGYSIGALLRDTSKLILDRSDMAKLLTYHQGVGSLRDRGAGAAWVEPCLGPVDPDRVLITPGAQVGLTALLTSLFKAGDLIVVEPLTYRGFLTLSNHLGLRLVTCPADEDGFDPDALRELCDELSPRGIYCVPTFNPATTAVMSIERRMALARICEDRGIALIEDDAYGRLPETPVPAVCTWAHTCGYYVSTLSKSLSPALRHAFVVAPTVEAAQNLTPGLRQIAIMPAPLMSAVATEWIRQGLAETLLEGVRAESRERAALAKRLLPNAHTAPECPHVWIDLPDSCENTALRNLLRPQMLWPCDAQMLSALARPPRNGVRISLGSSPKRSTLEKGLRAAADIFRLVASAA